MKVRVNEQKVVGGLRIPDINIHIAYKEVLTIPDGTAKKSKQLQRLLQERKVLRVDEGEIQRELKRKQYARTKTEEITKLSIKEATKKIEKIHNTLVLEKLLQDDPRKSIEVLIKRRLKDLIESKELEEL